MKKLLYYIAIVAAFIVTWVLCSFICAALYLRGSFLMIIIATLSLGASKLTAILLKDKLNPNNIQTITENENE